MNGNPVSTAISDLQTLLTSDASVKPSDTDLQQKIAAIRTARAKARRELDSAQTDLLLLLTPQQEAILLAQGYLD
jgi:hypothetical protein